MPDDDSNFSFPFTHIVMTIFFFKVSSSLIPRGFDNVMPLNVIRQMCAYISYKSYGDTFSWILKRRGRN